MELKQPKAHHTPRNPLYGVGVSEGDPRKDDTYNMKKTDPIMSLTTPIFPGPL